VDRVKLLIIHGMTAYLTRKKICPVAFDLMTPRIL
jgi:hypothetical protein